MKQRLLSTRFSHHRPKQSPFPAVELDARAA